MLSSNSSQKIKHTVAEKHDCGHNTTHKCTNRAPHTKESGKCTFKIPVALHGIGVRRMCPTCAFNLATVDAKANLPSRWWEEERYVEYMVDPKKPILPKRSNAIKPKTPIEGSLGFGTSTWQKKFDVGNETEEGKALFGTPPKKKEPAGENAGLSDELKRAATLGTAHHYTNTPEDEPKKPSRISSIRNSIKRVFSTKKGPKEAKKDDNEGEPTRWDSVKNKMSLKKPRKKDQDDIEDNSPPGVGETLARRIINDDLTEDQVLQMRKAGLL